MLKVSKARYWSKDIRALFVGENEENRIPNIRELGDEIKKYLSSSEEGKMLLDTCFSSKQGIKMEWDCYETVVYEDVEIAGEEIVETIVQGLEDWASKQEDYSYFSGLTVADGTYVKPLITTDIMSEVLRKLRNPLTLYTLDRNTIEDQFLRYDFYNDYLQVAIRPDCDFSKFEDDWRNTDHTNFICCIGEVMTLLNHNLPDWITGIDNVIQRRASVNS